MFAEPADNPKDKPKPSQSHGNVCARPAEVPRKVLHSCERASLLHREQIVADSSEDDDLDGFWRHGALTVTENACGRLLVAATFSFFCRAPVPSVHCTSAAGRPLRGRADSAR